MIYKNSTCVGYEVDFIGVSKENASKDADAICFRWKMSDDTYKIGVYDAGFQAHGKAMVQHINKYYFDDENEDLVRDDKLIDYVFVSHPHNDHAGGIPEIIENFSIGCIYMNRPWLYTEELLESSNSDGRTTRKSLEKELLEDFLYVSKIEKLAGEYGIEIKEAFAGTEIEDGLLKIFSPQKDFYLEKIIESNKTKRIRSVADSCILTEMVKSVNFNAIESWDDETLGDDHAGTDAENETSIVLYGFKNKGGMLLTGDAGVEALSNADIQAAYDNIFIEDDVNFVEIPHHGGRHNVTTYLMDRIFGKPVGENETPEKTAYVSVADGSDHPRKVVVNAFIRRGFKVFKTTSGVRRHREGDMPNREGFSSSTDKLIFSKWVEEW